MSLTIEIKKQRDGSSVLSCRRGDGSVTWQHHGGAQARFFPLHDLTHYAVETVLCERVGFYRLLAEGWNISDFGDPWPRGPLPEDAGIVELIVGFLDMERADGATWPAVDFNAHAASYFAEHGARTRLELDDETLQRIRAARDELFGRWSELPAGSALILEMSPRTKAPPRSAHRRVKREGQMPGE